MINQLFFFSFSVVGKYTTYYAWLVHLWNEPINEKCPECGNILVKKIQKKMPKIACSNKDCKYIRDVEVEQND